MHCINLLIWLIFDLNTEYIFVCAYVTQAAVKLPRDPECIAAWRHHCQLRMVLHPGEIELTELRTRPPTDSIIVAEIAKHLVLK